MIKTQSHSSQFLRGLQFADVPFQSNRVPGNIVDCYGNKQFQHIPEYKKNNNKTHCEGRAALKLDAILTASECMHKINHNGASQ